jgi:hypothetical protein
MSAPKCPACQADLPVADGSVGEQTIICGNCRGVVELETFPAQWRKVQPGRAGELVTGEESACFVHTDRRAEAACDSCGRFMCALCEVRVGEQRICVACLESGRRAGRLAQVERSRTIFALVALRVALFGLLLGPFGPAAGMSAIVLAVIGLRKPASVTGRRYIGSAIAALVLGALLTLGWAWWWVSVFGQSGEPVFTEYE